MGFKKILGKVADKIEEKAEDIKESRAEKKRKQEEFEIQLQKEKEMVIDLLDKFTINELGTFCREMIGRSPEEEIKSKLEDKIEDEEKQGWKEKLHTIRPNRLETADRKTYYDFIEKCLKEKEIKFLQIKDWALGKQIVMPSHFDKNIDTDSSRMEFEKIIEKISQFIPEKFDLEQDFEDQLVIYLKANFPKSRIDRQVEVGNNDRLDVLIDDKFALELKVPSARADLRNLKAQLEEYKENFPLLCAVIFEDILSNKSVNKDLREFADIYRRQLNVPTIVIEGERRPRHYE